MPLYEVTCEVKLPDAIPVTEGQVEDWATFYLNATGSLSGDNPLQDLDFEAAPFTVRVRRLR
jgi:hypothetical protein